MKAPDLAPGWVDRITPVHGETNAEQLLRARGGRPGKIRTQAAYAVTVRKGARKGAEARRLVEVLDEVMPEEEE